MRVRVGHHHMAGVGVGEGATRVGVCATRVGKGEVATWVGVGESTVLVGVGVVVEVAGVGDGRGSLQWLLLVLIIVMPHSGEPEPLPDSLL